jgi:cytochrome c biogenesis protein CcdA/thiol-disulfide isomerase/thioredoxin
MQEGFIHIGLSFIEGLALIVSPCILPILPIILAGSFSESKKRPLGIIIGFILFFSLFTFFTRTLLQYSNIDVNLFRHLSYGILIALGIIMLSTYLTEKWNSLIQRLFTGTHLASKHQAQESFISGLFFGGLVALIWTPCAGPILAAVLIQTVLQQTDYLSLFTLLAFSIGVAVPMLCIVFFGRNMVAKMAFFKTHTAALRKALGIIIILSVLFIINLEYGFFKIPSKTLTTIYTNRLINGLAIPYKAPEIEGIETWINSPPLQIHLLKNKVILVDFWTYSCINCLRTLPYLKGWYDKYHKNGLIIIGVHAPEFAFERDVSNVQTAVKHLGIPYPVALDNKYQTWRNFQNSYWPAHYLIDKNGKVVYTHFGEGEYDVTENNIRYLLGLDMHAKPKAPEVSISNFQSPEIYFGYERTAHFASHEKVIRDKPTNYTPPQTLSRNQWALSGKWTILPEKILAEEANASLTMHFYARHVYAVMGSHTGKEIPVTVTLNGKYLATLSVKNHKLYEIGTLDQAKNGTVTLTTMSSGLEVYTFTFG